MCKNDPISRGKLMKWLHLVVDDVTLAMIKDMEDLMIGIEGDEWASPQHRKILGLFAIYIDRFKEIKKVMLAVTPLEDETTSTAANLGNTIIGVLADFKKAIADVKYLVGDNTFFWQFIIKLSRNI